MDISELTAQPASLARIRRTIALLERGMTHVREAPPGDARGDKAACEIALLFWALLRNGYQDPETSTTVPGLIDVAERRLRSPAILQGLLWKPARVAMLSMGTALLNGLGRPDPIFDRIARGAWRSSFLHSAERSPFQQMEVAWCAGMLGIDSPVANPDTGSLLQRRFCPLLMGAEDSYAVTHAVFYATDFGHAPLPTSINRPQLWAALDEGVLASLLRFDFDLLGEFLLSALYCRMPPTPIFRIGLHALLLTWDEYGFVPDREIDGSDAGSGKVFFGLYHANLVAALLSQELLVRQDGNAPRADPATPPLSATASACRSLAHELTQAGHESIAARGLDHYHRFGSAQSLLEIILGSRITTRLAAALGEATMTSAFPDLLMAYGLIHFDLQAVLAGARKSLPADHVSATTVCATEWLLMARTMFATGLADDFPERAAMDQLLQSLRIKLIRVTAPRSPNSATPSRSPVLRMRESIEPCRH